MKRSAICCFLAILFLIPSSTASQSASIHQQIQQTYDFHPHLLSNRQITEKSAALDQFWTKPKAEPSLYAPALRDQLVAFKNPPSFLYDASMLRLSLSDASPDRTNAMTLMS